MNASQACFMAGNEVAGESALRAGLHFYAGYPITPQNDLGAYMAREMPPRGRTLIQAESELAAINMVFGASAAGARSMTSSSSPGVSLKQEGISYMAGCELPGVIVNVMRGGPGLGNISGSQGDYFQSTRGGGHGDYRCITLAPGSVQEIADHVFLAFDLAEQYRLPALVIYDGYLGQLEENVILPDPVDPPSMDHPWALSGNEGRKSRVVRSLMMGEGELERHVEDLHRRYETISENEVRYEASECEDAEVLLVAFGTAARQCAETVLRLRRDGVRAGLFRPVTLWPFPEAALRSAGEGARRVLVVEMNTGQMLEDVRLSLQAPERVEFLGRSAGGVPTVGSIRDRVRALAGGSA